MTFRKTTAILYAAAIVLGAPVSALAATSTQGSNYSYDSGDVSYTMNTCDRESDSRHVYAEYQIGTGEWSSVTDGNGANNSCASRGTYPDILQHRTCEAIDFAPDSCGNYVYP
ncbi:hypothetical protein ACQP2X_26050 [Actinoplanes sp. CA-131856]